MKAFKLGDNVRWKSQAAGFSKIKKGVVVAVVPANAEPHHYIPNGFPYTQGFGYSRNHESYLVRVRKLSQLYWPRVSHLLESK